MPVLGYCVGSADPFQMPPNRASDQSLLCLLMVISMKNAVKLKSSPRNPLNYEWTDSDDNVQVHWSEKG